MRIASLLLALFCCSIVTGIAQGSGYQGKNTLLKVNVGSILLENEYGVEAEWAFGRSLSLSANFRYQRPRIDSLALEDWDEIEASVQMFGVSLKKYLNPATPAPLGVYYIANFQRGVASVDRNRVERRPGNFSNFEPYQISERIQNVRYTEIAFGFGRQWIWNSRFVFDLSSLAVWNKANAGEYTREFWNSSRVNSGNLIALVNDQGAFPLSWGFGVSIHASLGVLLF